MLCYLAIVEMTRQQKMFFYRGIIFYDVKLPDLRIDRTYVLQIWNFVIFLLGKRSIYFIYNPT